MGGRFAHFTKLPRDIQWDIVERSIMHSLMSLVSSPCVQALALYALLDPTLPEGPFQRALVQDENLARNSELIKTVREGHDRDRLRFLFPNPALSRFCSYGHAFDLTLAAPVLTARNARCVSALSTLLANELGSGQGDNSTSEELPVWEVDNRKSICIIDTIWARLTDEDKKRAVCPDIVMGANAVLGRIPVILKPTTDLLWLDFASTDDGHGPRRLAQVLESGVYNSHLIPVRQIAVDFDEPHFRTVCQRCERLKQLRRDFEEWRGVWNETCSDDVCLLCTVLAKSEFADLSAEQKREIKNWLKMRDVRTLVAGVSQRRLSLTRASGRLDRNPLRSPGRSVGGKSYDGSTFRLLYHSLERVLNALETTKRASETSDGRPIGRQHLYACFAHFGGDELAFYYNSVKLQGEACRPEDYDAETEATICSARRDGDPQGWPEVHLFRWCRNTEALVKIWPVTTPNLKTLYAIDRGIKLRPGASIPPDSRTFRGNGCLFVEVRPPANRSLWDGGRDDVWQYPRARHGGVTVFDFARLLRQRMRPRHWTLGPDSIYRTFDPANLPDLVVTDSLSEIVPGQSVDSPQIRAIEAGRIPDCKILAIVEETPTPQVEN